MNCGSGENWEFAVPGSCGAPVRAAFRASARRPSSRPAQRLLGGHAAGRRESCLAVPCLGLLGARSGAPASAFPRNPFRIECLPEGGGARVQVRSICDPVHAIVGAGRNAPSNLGRHTARRHGNTGFPAVAASAVRLLRWPWSADLFVCGYLGVGMRDNPADGRQAKRGEEAPGVRRSGRKDSGDLTREERLAVALRANLRRRKQQARGRSDAGDS